jgi:undecaprenyl diphosphate synthase
MTDNEVKMTVEAHKKNLGVMPKVEAASIHVAGNSGKVKDGELNAGDIDEQTINDHLWTNFMPDPELLIRTGGELRISNYLLWQCAYSEFYFCDTYWPDFDQACLHKAIESYQSRQRRFGKTEAQVEAEEK